MHHFTIRHKTAIFKVMIKASVVKIYGTAGCHYIVCHTHLCMAKARCPLKNPHTMLHKLVVEGSCHAVYWFLIRYARRDDAHVNSTLGGKCQRMAHLICNDKVRSDKPAITLCLVCHADIDILTHLLVIERAVCIWLDKSTLFCLIIIVQQILRYIHLARHLAL